MHDNGDKETSTKKF